MQQTINIPIAPETVWSKNYATNNKHSRCSRGLHNRSKIKIQNSKSTSEIISQRFSESIGLKFFPTIIWPSDSSFQVWPNFFPSRSRYFPPSLHRYRCSALHGIVELIIPWYIKQIQILCLPQSQIWCLQGMVGKLAKRSSRKDYRWT